MHACVRLQHRGAEEVHGVGEGERVLSSRALVEHVRGHGGEAFPARGVGGRTRAYDEGDLDDRDLVHGDEEDGEAVGQGEALDRRQPERAHGAGLRWGAAVGLGESGSPEEDAAASERRGLGRSSVHLRHREVLLSGGTKFRCRVQLSRRGSHRIESKSLSGHSAKTDTKIEFHPILVRYLETYSET